MPDSTHYPTGDQVADAFRAIAETVTHFRDPEEGRSRYQQPSIMMPGIGEMQCGVFVSLYGGFGYDVVAMFAAILAGMVGASLGSRTGFVYVKGWVAGAPVYVSLRRDEFPADVAERYGLRVDAEPVDVPEVGDGDTATGEIVRVDPAPTSVAILHQGATGSPLPSWPLTQRRAPGEAWPEGWRPTPGISAPPRVMELGSTVDRALLVDRDGACRE